MAGMHRDKGGASAVAGFMQAIDLLKPKNIRIIAGKILFCDLSPKRKKGEIGINRG